MPVSAGPGAAHTSLAKKNRKQEVECDDVLVDKGTDESNKKHA